MALGTSSIASGAPMAALPGHGWAPLYQPFANGMDADGRSPRAFEKLGGLALPASRSAGGGGAGPPTPHHPYNPPPLPAQQEKTNP